MCSGETSVKMCSDLKVRKNNILEEIDSLCDISKGNVSDDVLGYISSRLFRLKAELDNVNFLLSKSGVSNYSRCRNYICRIGFEAQC